MYYLQEKQRQEDGARRRMMDEEGEIYVYYGTLINRQAQNCVDFSDKLRMPTNIYFKINVMLCR